MSMAAGDERVQFFTHLLKCMEEAASRGYSNLLVCCQENQLLFKQKYPQLPYMADASTLQQLRTDTRSAKLLPTEWKHVTPLMCYGDGNCLYRAASILCSGSQLHHAEFRVRTLCELVLHQQHYLQPSIISLLDPDGIVVSKNALIATSENFFKAHSECTIDVDFATVVLQLDCLGTAKNGTYSNMIHLHGLASVLECSITSIYPEVQSRIRPLLHRVVYPRQMGTQREKVQFMIMWTSTRKTEVTGEWSPNHFVPCYDKQSIEEIVNSTTTQKQHTLPSNVPRANISSPLTSSHAQVQYAYGQDPSSSTDTKLPECKMVISTSTTNSQLPASPFSSSSSFELTITDPLVSASPFSSSSMLESTVTDSTVSASPLSSSSMLESTSTDSIVSASPFSSSSMLESITTDSMVSANPFSASSMLGSIATDSIVSASPFSSSSMLGSITTDSMVSASPFSSSSRLESITTDSMVSASPFSSSSMLGSIATNSMVSASPFSSSSMLGSIATDSMVSASPFSSSSMLESITTDSMVSASPFSSSSMLKSTATDSMVGPFTFTSVMESQLTTSPSSSSLLKSTTTKSMVMALSKIHTKRKSFPTKLNLAIKVNEKESASLFNFHSASKTTIPTKISENKASTSKPVYSQLTTCPSSSSMLKSKSMVMALSKMHSKRKPGPTKLNLAHKVNKESTSLFDFYSASELITLASVNKDNTDISTPMCTTPSAMSTSMAITHSSADHEAIPKKQSTSTEHAKTSMEFTVQSPQVNVAPSISTQLITHMETTSSVTTTRNLLKAIATITSKQSKSKKKSTMNTKPITSYFSTQDHSNDIIYHGAHPKLQVPEHVLSYSDSDNEQLENEFTYIYSKSDTESDSDSSNSGSAEISMEIPTTVVQTAVNILPFTAVSTEWYVLQNRLAKHNFTRDVIHQAITVETDDDGLIYYVNRSEVQGTLEKNVADLQMQIASASQAKRNHLEAILLVGKHFLSTGPLISTQELGAIYMRQKGLKRRYDSVALYDIFCKHLNISQIYLFGRGYAVQNNDNLSVCSVVTSIKKMFDTHKEDLLTKVAAERLSDIFRPALQYMDTPRDRQVLKGLISEMTNIDFTTRLQGIQNRRSTRKAKHKLPILLCQYKDICKTSQIVRNDLTVLQQHQLTQRMISQRKLKEIRVIAEGRGRKLKCSEFPELATVLSYAFGEYDMQQGGGGLEAHPRLTNGTLYQTTDSVTTMKRAREILLSMAPKGFTISLSTCYNYTENYRGRSSQAKRHHAGRGVNALISLGKPPRTGVEQLVINLHWSTANVNLIVDACHDLSQCIVVSKDAKAIIPGDISPVQRPGRSWKPREHPDHTWDQSRVNAITPMTFLFLSTVIKQQPSSTVQEFDLFASDCTTLHLTRTGQGVTLINLSFYEPETTFRCINELLYLLTLSSLDCFFRDQKTGSLKKEFIFVVDNGPSEQPSSPLVQMMLVRLVRLLNLDKVTQVSFAEYHSKRNYVERVHAEENRVLSSHGPFSSKVPNKQATPGTPEHKQNMENMAEEVKKCIAQGSFGGNQLLAFRGVKCADFVFNDQEEVQRFLDLSEDNKKLFTPESYCAAQDAILNNLHFIWGANRPFTGRYLHDYRALGNDLIDGRRTAWLDKYTTSVYSTDGNSNCRRHELQPLPDYLRWFKTNELHYLPLEERCLLNGDWDDIPGIYLPTKVVDLCLSVVPKPDDSLILQIALLSWVTPREVKDYISKQENQFENQVKSEMQRRRWKVHPLYKNNNREKLAGMCKSMHIPVTSALAKHDLAALICEKKGEPCPPEYTQPLYHGKLSAVPCTTSAINKLTIQELRAILKHHGYSTIGTKDQLILRVFMLRHNKRVGITAREEEQLKDLVQLTYKLIYEQRKLSLNSHVYRKRTYTLQTVKPHFVPLPNHVSCEQDLKHLFQPFVDHINEERSKREEEDKIYPPTLNESNPGTDLPTDEQFKQVGAKIKVQWSDTEVEGTGWRPGWFTATVQQYCEETDTLVVKYSAEQGQLYEEELTPLISSNKIKLVSSPL